MRNGRNTSERHSALARMRERHAKADRFAGGDEPPAAVRPQPRAPTQTRASDPRPVRSFSGSGRIDTESPVEPWAPAWSPDSAHRNDDDFAMESPPPAPRQPVPPEAAPRKSRPVASERLADEQPIGKGSRVRGPNEVKSARDKAEEDDALPPGAQSADFKTLQAMIARGIQDAEIGASTVEKNVPIMNGDDEEERRYRERQRQRREQEAEQREKEREKARQKRRREEEERQRRQVEELEREELQALRQREEKAQWDAQCCREFAAATRIQARVRGRRARAGKPSSAPHIRAKVHAQPSRDSYLNRNSSEAGCFS